MTVKRLYLAALVWGIISVIVSFIIMAGHHVSVPVLLQIVFDLVTAAIIFLAGRAAKQQGAKPVGAGVVSGLIFGVVSGWPAFFAHVTRSELTRSLHGRHLSPAQFDAGLTYANSPVAHIVTWVGLIVVTVVLGLVLGAIGGATAKNRSVAEDV